MKQSQIIQTNHQSTINISSFIFFGEDFMKTVNSVNWKLLLDEDAGVARNILAWAKETLPQERLFHD